MLLEMRKEAGYTQIELAQKLNLTQHLISRGELGDRKIDVVELCRFCEACNVLPEEFIARYNQGLKKLEQQLKEGKAAAPRPERERRVAVKERPIRPSPPRKEPP